MPSRLSPLVVAAVSAAAAADDDDDGGGGGGDEDDEDDDDNDNDDNYDDDDGALAPDRPSMAKPAMWTISLSHHDINQEDINASHLRSPRGVGACTMHSIFLILSRAPVNRGLPSIVGADKARWHTPRPIVRARWILVLWPPGLEGRLAHL